MARQWLAGPGCAPGLRMALILHGTGRMWQRRLSCGNAGLPQASRPTIDYVRRRTAEGKTKREITRCLKRFVAREIVGHLCRAPKSANPEQMAA